jgi:hypothetical protein
VSDRNDHNDHEQNLLESIQALRQDVQSMGGQLEGLARAIHGDAKLSEHRGLRQRMELIEDDVLGLIRHRDRVTWVGTGILIGQSGLNIAALVKLFGG